MLDLVWSMSSCATGTGVRPQGFHLLELAVLVKPLSEPVQKSMAKSVSKLVVKPVARSLLKAVVKSVVELLS